MGKNGLRAMLNAAGLQDYIDTPPPNNMSQDIRYSDYAGLQQAIEDFYGPRGARAVLSQIGRVTFRYTLEQQPAILGLAGLALKMLPEHTKVRMVLKRMQSASTEQVNIPATIEEDEDTWYFVASHCPCTFRDRTATNQACYTTVGTIQEALRWATGKHYLIREIECLNLGDSACKYRIDKSPQPDNR